MIDEGNVFMCVYLLLGLFTAGFLVFNSLLFIIDDEPVSSHRDHQSIAIKNHNEPGLDVGRL